MSDGVARRGLLGGGLWAAVSLASTSAEAAGSDLKLPWIKRVFHLYTGPDGLTRAEILKPDPPAAGERPQLLRRTAERLTLGAMAPGTRIDFHNANQPTFLIPLFGSIIIGLADGTTHEFGHGDMAYAEDCTGKGHISMAGKEGCFTVQIQLVRPLCPASGSSDMSKIWHDPA